jgi:glycosyltransferase involved in cell wall biosynthesis
MVPQRWQRLCYGAGIPANLRRSRWVTVQIPLLVFSAFFKTLTSCGQCDVLHAFWSLSGLVAVIAGHLLRKPVVLTAFGVEVLVRNRLNRLLTGWVIRHSNAVIAISHFTRQRLLEIGSPHTCEVIPFGVDLDVKLIPDAETELRRRLGVSEETKVILALGRLVERKGFSYLVRAAAKVTRQTSACVVIGGSGPCREELSELAKSLGLQDKVHLVGFINAPDLPLYFRGSHVFVLPSIEDAAGDTEGLGMVLLEAQAHKKPIIGSRIGGIPDIIEDGKNGFLVAPRDVEALTERIITLLTDEALAAQMGRAGRKRLEQLFGWEQVISRLLETYATATKNE